MIRAFRRSDETVLRAIHEKAGYGFEFPDLKGLIGKKVIVSEEGTVVGVVGAQKEAQIIGIFDPSWGTPGERMRVFASLHAPIAAILQKLGIREVYVACDPKFRAFGRRLISFGWKKALWPHFWLRVDDCLALFRREGADNFER